MFGQTSRYVNCEDEKFVTKDNKIISYKKRRFLPQPEKINIVQEIDVIAGDRLDNITAKVLGDAEQYWRICDANNTMHPDELISEPGKIIKIASPWVQ